MYIWKVVISYLGTKKVIKIKGNNGQSNLDVFNGAKAYAMKLKEADTDKTTKIELVSGTRAYPPKKDTKLRKYEYWCPYCVKPRVFITDQELGVKKCPVCGISDSEYYVKKYNGIFKEEYQDYLFSLKSVKE